MGTQIRERSERRLTDQLLLNWQQLRDGRLFPQHKDIDPGEFGELWDDAFVFEVLEETAGKLHHTGARIKALLNRYNETERARLKDALTRSLPRVMEMQKPVMEQSHFPLDGEQGVKYRLILLPLGGDEAMDTIQYVLGGLRYKEFALDIAEELPAEGMDGESKTIEDPLPIPDTPPPSPAPMPQQDVPLFKEEPSPLESPAPAPAAMKPSLFKPVKETGTEPSPIQEEVPVTPAQSVPKTADVAYEQAMSRDNLATEKTGINTVGYIPSPSELLAQKRKAKENDG